MINYFISASVYRLCAILRQVTISYRHSRPAYFSVLSDKVAIDTLINVNAFYMVSYRELRYVYSLQETTLNNFCVVVTIYASPTPVYSMVVFVEYIYLCSGLAIIEQNNISVVVVVFN